MRYCDNFEKALIASVNHSDDSDSTGAVTGNIVGAYNHFEKVWHIVERMSNNIRALDFTQNMSEKPRTMLDRYAVLKTLQDFEHNVVGKGKYPDFPN